MILVNRVGDMISGSVNGKQFSVSYGPEKYDAMKKIEAAAQEVETMAELQQLVTDIEPLTRESFKELVETATPYLFVNKASNRYYLRFKEEISKEPVPDVLVKRILTSIEKGIDINPLIKFWARFLRKVPYDKVKAELLVAYIEAPYVDYSKKYELMKEGISDEKAEELSTCEQVSFTQEGLMVGYKVSREILHRFTLDENEEVKQQSRFGKEVDPETGKVTIKKAEHNEDRVFEPAVMGQGGDAFVCESIKDSSVKSIGHLIKVGHVHYLESWDQVDCNDSVAGRKGLHVGGLRYIQGYQTEGTVTHNVLIDPADIGAIVGLGNGNDGAIRVKRYMVFDTYGGVNKFIYHHSKYAALTDNEYAVMIQEAVANTQKAKDDIDAAARRAADLM